MNYTARRSNRNSEDQAICACNIISGKSGDDKMASYVDFGIAPVRTIETLVMKSQV